MQPVRWIESAIRGTGRRIASEYRVSKGIPLFREGKAENQWARLKYGIARFQEDPTNLFVEWLVGSFAAILGAGLLGHAEFAVAAFYTFMFLVLIQWVAGIRIASSVGYVLDLAYRASGRNEGSRPLPLRWHAHLKRTKRVGESLTWGRFDKHLLITLNGRDTDSSNRAPSFDEVGRAIEMGLLEESGKLPRGKRREPFLHYAMALDASVHDGDFTFARLRDFLVTAYALLPPEVRAASREAPTTRDRLEAWYDRHKGKLAIAGVVAAILTLIVGLR